MLKGVDEANTHRNIFDLLLEGHAFGAVGVVVTEADAALDPNGTGAHLGKHAHVRMAIRGFSHAALMTAIADANDIANIQIFE